MDEWKVVSTEWVAGGAYIGKNAQGVEVQMGALGDEPGVSPMDLLLIALAGCTAMDITTIMEKKKQPLTSLKIIVRGKRREDFPKYYEEIKVEYLVFGELIEEKALKQAIQLSEEKYCSVGATLSRTAKITSTYFINPA